MWTPSDSCGFDGRWDTSRLQASMNMSSTSSLHRLSGPGHSWNIPPGKHLGIPSQRHSHRSHRHKNHRWNSEHVTSFSGISCPFGEEPDIHRPGERRPRSLRSKLGVLNNSRTRSLRSKPGGTRHASFDSTKVPTTPKWGGVSTSLLADRMTELADITEFSDFSDYSGEAEIAP